ncbi:hypothetical protein DRO47_05005 [Candidatus Bathyarchaeota archaeon]|nr:PIN domain-containing protein [Candidatus Bathyarchaeota archaeon]RJS80717.1 MAG: type II toxin-antitoxin system VapC family toxin [Candidatus Bathyarchaeota archaeon]RLG98878.1 MAG: hypothetical protein DRO28_01970 [Candidatus Bathyarchaeota archaeon]RLI20368.1 MAG: hypothetical protein DRO47_05005 [Candidatus Bathyarchaeota archaeon]HDM45051.1 type II toxin-antitoxin system VapC family toxin [Candidatus Bathyarchaeota archaeon]
MTSVADTRLLLTLEFPPDQETKSKIEALMRQELSRKLVLPAIVLTEFLKVAGSRIGKEAASTRIRVLKSRGAKVIPLDERSALLAGNLLLEHPEVPIADALIASIVFTGKAKYVITNDPHFKTLGVKTRWI